MYREETEVKIAVVNELSARDKNPFIIKALLDKGCEVINIGMTDGDFAGEPLTYIHTGLVAAIALNLGCADFVVGGCGTGQGFMISAMQYPNVFCGLIESPLDAWLFGQINGGNCISLALNKGFGWAGDINLNYIVEKLLQDKFGSGYPEARKESQQASRQTLQKISLLAHKSMQEILQSIDSSITNTIFSYPPIIDMVQGECRNKELQTYIINNFLGDKR